MFLETRKYQNKQTRFHGQKMSEISWVSEGKQVSFLLHVLGTSLNQSALWTSWQKWFTKLIWPLNLFFQSILRPLLYFSLIKAIWGTCDYIVIKTWYFYGTSLDFASVHLSCFSAVAILRANSHMTSRDF